MSGKISFADWMRGGVFYLAFLTLNLELVPMGEYQPTLFLAYGMVALVCEKRLSRTTFYVTILFLVTVLLGLLFSDQPSVSDALRLLIAPLFLVLGWAIFKATPMFSYKLVIYSHIVLLALALMFRGAVVDVLGHFFPRGVAYYDGYNSFFSSEPSFVALNLTAVFILYLLRRNASGGESQRSHLMIGLSVMTVLVFTKSVTGIFCCAIIGCYYALQYVRRVRKFVMAGALAAVGVLLLPSSDSTSQNVESATRVASFFLHSTEILSQFSLATWALFEPASSARPIANLSAFVEGLNGTFGRGNLALDGPSGARYPDWLANAFDANLTLGQGINAQTPLFNLVAFSGGLGIAAYLILAWLCLRGHDRLPDGKTKLVFYIYSLIALFWQSALGSPFFWIMASILLSYPRTVGRLEASRKNIVDGRSLH